MQINKLFGVPFWRSYPLFDINAVAGKCLQMKNDNYPNRKVSNRGGWQSQFIDMDTMTEFRELSSEIKKNLKIIAASIDPKVTLIPSHAWININERGDYNIEHNHSSYNATLSSVIYIQVDKDSGNIIFTDNFSATAYYPHMLPSTRKLLVIKEQVEPKAGMMLTFPAWIPHSVQPSKSDLTRISIAFNVKVGER